MDVPTWICIPLPNRSSSVVRGCVLSLSLSLVCQTVDPVHVCVWLCCLGSIFVRVPLLMWVCVLFCFSPRVAFAVLVQLDTTALIPIYAGDRRVCGRMEMRIPDKKISRGMLEYNCKTDGSLHMMVGRQKCWCARTCVLCSSRCWSQVFFCFHICLRSLLCLQVQGLNIAYFAATFQGSREPIRKNTLQNISDENCIFMLPGGVHALLFRRYSFWLTEDPETSSLLLESRGPFVFSGIVWWFVFFFVFFFWVRSLFLIWFAFVRSLASEFPFMRRTMTGSDFQIPLAARVPDLRPPTASGKESADSAAAASLITQVGKPSRQHQALVSPPKV
jgi:hypothetical protein